MPSSQLFGVNKPGHLFSISNDQSAWKKLSYIDIEFKRVASHDNVIWALGEDHQLYIYDYESPSPIRVCEESYENQRYYPHAGGFTSNLLPTDRTNFSSEDGLTDRTRDTINLPTSGWTWEGQWQLDVAFNGNLLDTEAWTYALDFPRSYTANKSWYSHVRRRKWVRYRRRIAFDTWSPVPQIHQDHAKEPFIDISIGGGEIQGEDTDKLMVWGVTALNRVMVREGVCRVCPEGVAWTHVATPAEQAILSVSVGRSGRVWAVTWDGVAMVRKGISKDNPIGTEWITVGTPLGSCLQQIAVGVNVVWALTRDHKVWFRQGFTNKNGSQNYLIINESGQAEDVGQPSDEPGTSWRLMDGSLNMIYLGPNDQVSGVTSEDNTAVIRTEVTSEKMAGQTWQPIDLPSAPEKINIFNDNSLQFNLQENILNECCVCREVHNDSSYRPLVLPCGCVMCKDCVNNVTSEDQSTVVQCPISHNVVHDLLRAAENIDQAQNGMSDTTKKILTGVGIGVGTVVTGVAAVLAAPVVLTGIGFTSAGIAAGSFAASMMSAAALAEGGGVAAGSLVALLQSAGAVGLGAGAAAGVGAAGATVGAAAGAGIAAGVRKSSGSKTDDTNTEESDCVQLFVYSVPVKFTLEDLYNHLIIMNIRGNQCAYVPNANSQSISTVICLIKSE
ncbi:unnamed protein product [Meganyctiphanes norvegica]|uniref:RING-type domain-containing protein n=1 Tax=Meganyctiphanes norvegica TaxID=48144 RepID=A0AAV2QE76_MEGNR